MPKLHQVLAVEKGKKTKSGQIMAKLYHDAQRAPLFSGLTRTYEPKDVEGEQQPPEATHVQVKGQKLVDGMIETMTDLLDVCATRDWANTEAKGTITVDGNVVLADVPVPFLIFLEKEIVNQINFIKKLPILDPADEWALDANTGVYKTGVVQTYRTKKVLRNHVLAKGTDKHPEQVQTFTEDVQVGTWNTVKFSGALPATTIERFLKQAEKLREAVQFAREDANSIEAQKQEVGQKLMEYIFKTE